jgi:hypothetical protein
MSHDQFNPDSIDAKVAEILSTVKSIDQTLAEHKKVTVTRLDDHAARIRSLERWQWMIMGASMAFGGLVDYVFRFFSK